MPQYDQKQNQTISWWIASLAMSTLLCAVFAGYVFDIKEDLKNSKIRSEIMEQRMDVLSSQLDNMRRHILLQQAQFQSEKSAPPKDALHDAVAPLPEGQSIDVAPAPMTVPSPPSVTAVPQQMQILRGSSHGHE